MGMFKRNDKRNFILTIITMIILVVCLVFISKQGIQDKSLNNTNTVNNIVTNEIKSENKVLDKDTTNNNQNFGISLEDVPEFSKNPYVVINENKPYFTEEELKNNKSFESYSELDNLNRCGVAVACIGKDLMPTEERGAIGNVKPSGWHTVKYDVVDGKYLYNRCHLIGFQLTAENANEKNLITGTRFLNVEGMLPFENMVADYIKETNNHVLYRVTPIFKDNNLVASGVLMEAQSIEDNGEGIKFNIYCYNNQPKIEIDYVTGESFELDNENKNESEGLEKVEEVYYINTSTKKIHKPTCSSVTEAKSKNIKEYKGSIEDLIKDGYEKCKKCNP